VGTLVHLTGAVWPGRCASLCLQSAHSGWWPAALVSDESVLEACTHDDALYKLKIFTFTFYLLPWWLHLPKPKNVCSKFLTPPRPQFRIVCHWTFRIIRWLL